MKNIRVVLTVTAANPELFADLDKVPARLRAERVRTLATIGLAAVSGGSIDIAKPSAHDIARTVQHEHGKLRRALSFAKTLGDNV